MTTTDRDLLGSVPRIECRFARQMLNELILVKKPFDFMKNIQEFSLIISDSFVSYYLNSCLLFRRLYGIASLFRY